ncbi:hypothetical protein [Shinella sp. BYT-45]|uniref:hypothetical protein n=1 Tax=Shinella sp. BYT-45 TaxID=3377377 RepID=UPI00397E9ABD
MTEFTPEEIVTELKRRKAEIERIESERRSDDARRQREAADTTCAHCGIPISSVGRFADFPLCDACDGD